VRLRDLTPQQRATLAGRFPATPKTILVRLMARSHDVRFPPAVGKFGPSRMQRASTGPWRQEPGTGPAAVEWLNQEVSFDWLCFRGSAHAHAPDSTSQVFAPSHDLSGAVIVRDALILYDRAARIGMAIPMSSHGECAAAVELWIHRYKQHLRLRG
jgi:hypothetical protein